MTSHDKPADHDDSHTGTGERPPAESDGRPAAESDGRPAVVAEKPNWRHRRIEVEVGPVAHGGHCVARHEGRVVFVRHSLPGERAVVQITDDTGGSFCRGDAVEILRPSADRVEPPCPFSGPGLCGGCDWQHASWDAQRDLKAAVVEEQLHRLANVDQAVVVEELPGGPTGWRTRMRMAVGPERRAGFRGHRRHNIVVVDECVIAAPGAVDEAVRREWAVGGELSVTRDAGGQVHITESGKPQPRNGRRAVPGKPIRRRGTGTAVELAAERTWRLDAEGFWQVHPAAADTLAAVVRDWAGGEPGQLAWDLYGGVGLFASVLAEQVGPTGRVVVVESSHQSIQDGVANLSDLNQVEFRRGKVEDVLSSPDFADQNPAVVVLDPPRKGAGKAVVAEIARRSPARVVYVACDPAALARDVATFAELGYQLAELRAFDAFPMTHHVECVALLVPRT